ncbi:MAG: SCP2 sterol-binding domain-containing protein [Candidatus Thorarchaeota archaeon]
MLNSKTFNSVLNDLENHDGEFIALLDKIIKFVVNKITTAEDLREEIIEFNDIYQIFVTDINFNFWFRASNGSIIYKKGINRNASFRVKYTKDLLVKILKREMNGTDAFMKGIIKADGDLSQGLRFIKLFRMFLEYLNNGFKK